MTEVKGLKQGLIKPRTTSLGLIVCFLVGLNPTTKVSIILITNYELFWSIQLFHETEKIRDGLLQESFTLRRSLELWPLDNIELSTQRRQDWLKQIEKFYHALEQLSDRLSPAYIEDSLPLAIQSAIKPWRCNPRLKIELELPVHWRYEPLERSLVIVRTLDELLRIYSLKLLTEMSIYISLKIHGDMGEIIVYISYPNLHTLVSYSNFKELEYLSQTFRLLTPGYCFRQRKSWR